MKCEPKDTELPLWSKGQSDIIQAPSSRCFSTSVEKRRDLAFPLIPQKHNILAATRRTCNSIRPQPRSIQASKNKSLTNIYDHNILSLFALGQAGCQKHSRTVLLQIERDYRSGGSVRKIVAGKEIENRSATKIPSATLFATAFLFVFKSLQEL